MKVRGYKRKRRGKKCKGKNVERKESRFEAAEEKK